MNLSGKLSTWHFLIKFKFENGMPKFLLSLGLQTLLSKHLKVEEANKKGEKIICSLMLDEMAIRKHVSWDGKRFRGYVDVGNGTDENDSSPVAKEALVLMAVAVNGSWKVPCGYFFIDGLNGKERANLVKVCIKKLSDVGVNVVSLTCNGTSCHFTMLQELGACLNIENLQCYFVHPLDKNKNIYVLLDVCHMLKLVRNTLGSYGILIDKDDNKVCWKYIIELQKLQDKEGLRLGNELKLAHIQWQQQKMKVDLAAQSLEATAKASGKKVRKTLNKLVLFKHQ